MHGFSNVAEIQDQFKTQDIVCLCETWNESLVSNSLFGSDFKLIQAPATRSHKYGRAKGGLLIAYNSNFYIFSVLFASYNQIFVKVNFRFNEFCFFVFTLYSS